MKSRKKIVYIFIFVLLITLVYNLPLFTTDSENLYTVKKDIVGDSIDAKGELKSSSSIFVGCPQIRRVWNFTIRYMAPEGKLVKKGQRILAFDTKKLHEKLAVKTSEFETAKKELEKARLVEQETLDTLMLSRAEAKSKTVKAKRKADQPEDLVAMHELKKLKLDYEVAQLEEKLAVSKIDNQRAKMKSRFSILKSKIKRLDHKIKEYKSAIAAMTVKAPRSGMLVYIANWRGKKRVVGDSIWRGDFIMEIPDLNSMNVEAVIPEAAAGRIKEGLTAQIRIDADPDKIYEGTVSSVGSIFRRKSKDQPGIVLDSKIQLKEANPDIMKPGMAASVNIILPGSEKALHIPNEAVIVENNATYVLKKGFFGSGTKTKVVLGKKSKAMVEVKSGLSESDVLVMPSKKMI